MDNNINNNNTSKISLVNRTRFAPSPTGYMHIGNLRTALYAFLFAKATKGEYILRIEDTDQKRYVEDSVDVIYRTLKASQIVHDEGPDVGGEFGPYIQSQRKDIYAQYAHKLVELGSGYYCFCGKEEIEEGSTDTGYNRKCRNLSKDEVDKNLKEGKPFVVRQKMPLVGTTSYDDIVYGKIKVANSTMEDQILLKSDGLPTYNFANVIDDHLMKVTHIIRGADFVTSTPKYKLLYEAFGWEVPQFAHLPLIMGMDEQGNVSKLSKRFGATSFDELVKEGYLPESIINYIALLGWSPKNDREIYSMTELQQIFKLEDVSKSPSIFDYKKLKWMNGEYIKNLTDEELLSQLKNYVNEVPEFLQDKWQDFVKFNKERLQVLTDINTLISDVEHLENYEVSLLENEKNKISLTDAEKMINLVKTKLSKTNDWTYETLHDVLHAIKDENGYKIGYVMWPIRIALTGRKFSPSATEYLYLLGKEKSFERLNVALEKIKNA